MSALVEPRAAGAEADLPAAQCPRCGVYLERLQGVPPSVALAGFGRYHPSDPAGRHSAGTPGGWRPARYGPGALSQ